MEKIKLFFKNPNKKLITTDFQYRENGVIKTYSDFKSFIKKNNVKVKVKKLNVTVENSAKIYNFLVDLKNNKIHTIHLLSEKNNFMSGGGFSVDLGIPPIGGKPVYTGYLSYNRPYFPSYNFCSALVDKYLDTKPIIKNNV
jgi:hypothetical protein